MVKNTFNTTRLTGSQTTPEEILDQLKNHPVAYGLYLNFPTQYQKDFTPLSLLCYWKKAPQNSTPCPKSIFITEAQSGTAA